ncbi:MAG: hypothetical protein E7291_08075 [Lachnospiraceae bacterium]|nr:hypothetical protein [Lachnospiraceae bacterium]
MTKEEIKALVREKLSAKRIILFGAGVVAEEFYKEHKDKLNISHCVSNLEKEWGEAAFLGELDVRRYCKEDLQENDYIVVCGPKVFGGIELQLAKDGLEMYADFVESGIAKVIFSGKKIAFFYGRCGIRDLRLSLITVPAFVEEYASIYKMAKSEDVLVKDRRTNYLVNLCDLYVYAPMMHERTKSLFIKPEDLPADCRIISVSSLVMPIYWPQIETRVDVYNEYYMHPYMIKKDLNFSHTHYLRADLNINKMVLEGKTTGQIVEALSSADYYSTQFLHRSLRVALRMLDVPEMDVDVKIADYIRENYTKVKLHQNFLHPNKSVIWEYVRRFLKVINVSVEEVDRLESEAPLHIHQGGDVPIYPCVAKYLGLEFVDENTKYEILTGNGVVQMDFRESIEHFAEYTRKAMTIMQMW